MWVSEWNYPVLRVEPSQDSHELPICSQLRVFQEIFEVPRPFGHELEDFFGHFDHHSIKILLIILFEIVVFKYYANILSNR